MRVPITRIGNLILVEAKIGNQTGFFVLDTGAPYLVLNETYFRDLVVANQRTYTDVNGQSRSANVTYVPKLELRSLYYKNLRADLANLASIENSRGVKVLGLMGINLFLDLEM
ncbi:MAG: aspartyl protease family protein, partial [Salibacteraceae bacterium]|nr:aspartyl protease family protein [Salibacteraceae bacterium]